MSPAIPLPDSYSWGFVVARSIHAMADTNRDFDRYPKARGSNGRVTFIPHVTRTRHEDYPTAFVQHESASAKIVRGVMKDAENFPGIYLICGVYTVTFDIEQGSIPSFDIEVRPEHTEAKPLDLVTAAPYEPPEGITVQTVEIPSGGLDNEYLGRLNGRLVWLSNNMAVDNTVDEVLSDPTSKSHLRLLSTLEEFGITVDTSAGTRVMVGGVMVYGDTGWRALVDELVNGWVSVHRSYGPHLRRIGSTVTLLVRSAGLNGTDAENGYFYEVPGGFRPAQSNNYRSLGQFFVQDSPRRISHDYVSGANFLRVSGDITRRMDGSVTWITDDPWPTTLPGTPV